MRRRGFSVIELLVVIGIISVVFSMLLPAVQKARESANRVRCQNNLRQISIALHTHHSSLGFFPTGGGWATGPVPYAGFPAGSHYADTHPDTGSGTPPTGKLQPGSWAFQLLPYLEQKNIQESVADIGISNMRVTPIGIYFCPTRRKPAVSQTIGLALFDYLGSNMNGPSFDAFANTGNGIFRHNTQATIRIDDVRDGTSNTFAVGEKRLALAGLNSGDTAEDNEGYCTGWDIDTVGRSSNPVGRDVAVNTSAFANDNGSGSGITNGYFRWVGSTFGSSHSGGFNAVLVDGSVRTISYTISTTMFDRLANISDGAVVDLGD